MNVLLTPQLEEIVRKRIESGRYASAGEVIREALWLLELFDGVRASPRAQICTDVEAGWQDVEHGRVSDFDASDIKRRGRIRLFSQDKGEA